MTAASPPPPAAEPAAVAALREDLTRYTVDAVADLLGPTAAAALHREQRTPALLAARGAAGPVASLLRVFALGDEITRAELDAALPRTGTAGAERAGLVRVSGQAPADAVRGLVDLRPYAVADAAGQAHWWVASDLGEMVTGRPLAPDHVLGIGGASLTLAQLTVRAPRRRVLDVGTGCGIQALHATRHADAVVATDVSARALGFAAFNAALASVDVDLRRGSLLEPVAGERFDLVVSNPPFVITPRRVHDAGLPVMEYRDAARSGDDLVRDLVVGLGDLLTPGGVAQLLGNWEHRAGEGWRERVAGWLAAAGLDGWVVQREVQDPAEYAELWLRDGGLRPGTPGYEAAYAAWLADFAARGVEAVGLGYLVLVRPAGPGAPWRRLEEVTGPAHQPLGGHVAAVLAARAWLAGGPGLEGARLVVAPDVTEERYYRPGATDPEVILLRQGGGLGRTVRAGTALAAVVGACDGDLSVGQVLDALAGLLAVDRAALAGEVLPALHDLVLDGFVGPAG